MADAVRDAVGEAVGPARVLFTADAVGGIWSYVLTLARALSERGVSSVVATMGPEPDRDQRNEAAQVPGLALETSRYRLEWMSDPWDDVARASDWLRALEQRYAPDLVQVNGFAHAATPFDARVVLVAHSCVASWFRAVRGEALPARFDRYRHEVVRGLSAAALTVAPTAAMHRALAREYGARGPTCVIPNGAPARPRGGRDTEKAPRILAAGRLWDEAKNLRALDAAAAGLPWEVRIAGDVQSPEGATFEARHATLLGRLTPAALARALGEAAVFAHPARYEPFGLAPLEAAHAGCALVLGDLPSLREVWGDAALYACPDDPRALTRALATLIDDPRLRQAMAVRARARAKEYLPGRMADAYLGRYRSILAGAAVPPREEAPTTSARPFAAGAARCA